MLEKNNASNGKEIFYAQRTTQNTLEKVILSEAFIKAMNKLYHRGLINLHFIDEQKFVFITKVGFKCFELSNSLFARKWEKDSRKVNVGELELPIIAPNQNVNTLQSSTVKPKQVVSDPAERKKIWLEQWRKVVSEFIKFWQLTLAIILKRPIEQEVPIQKAVKVHDRPVAPKVRRVKHQLKKARFQKYKIDWDNLKNKAPKVDLLKDKIEERSKTELENIINADEMDKLAALKQMLSQVDSEEK